MRYLLLLITCITCSISTPAQILQNPSQAFAAAAQSGKKILLVFSGSDWCVPCIQFDKKVLADSTFLSFANDHLILLEADFPQRKKIPSPLRQQYDSLAAAFNPSGAFPQVVLLSPEKKLMANVPYRQQSPEGFIAALKQFMQ
jgi:thiamine biosynthesis lipoprotein